MLDFFLTLPAGWSAILVTVILAMIGLNESKYLSLVSAASLSFLFSWLLSGLHVIRSAIFLLPLSLSGSGYARYRGREMVAWILAQ